MNSVDKKPVAALLLIAPGCPHCSGVLETLNSLLKEGVIGTLEVVNVAAHPERAEALGIRSVPWVRVGGFESEGAVTPEKLRSWAELSAAEDAGTGAHFSHLLERRRLDQAVALIRADPPRLVELVTLLETEDTPLAVRIGVGAVMEELADSGLLEHAFQRLVQLTHSPEPHIRADACHYLALSGKREALPEFQRLLDDENHEVREIARESLEALAAAGPLH